LSRAGSRSPSEPSTESLAEALTALCAEVGIPFEEMLHTVEGALATAYVRAFSPSGYVTVKLDTATGALEVRSRTVRPDGTEVVELLPSENFKRMAAQTAKHAVLRHIHDLERDKNLRDVAEHRGELASGVVDREEAGTVFVDLGRVEGVMPPGSRSLERSCIRAAQRWSSSSRRSTTRGRRRYASRGLLAPSSTAFSRLRYRRSRRAPFRSGPSRVSQGCARKSRCRRPSRASTRLARASVQRACATARS
jgi:hypothetical protein